MMAVPSQSLVDPVLYFSEGYGRRFLNLISSTGKGFNAFVSLCQGKALMEESRAIENPKKLDTRTLRRREARERLLENLRLYSDTSILGKNDHLAVRANTRY